MQAIVDRLAEKDSRFQAFVRPMLGRQPFEVSESAQIVRILRNCAEMVLGRAPEFIGHSWWEDSALLAEAGIETVVYGPEGEGIHTSEEWVDIESATNLARVLATTALEYCG